MKKKAAYTFDSTRHIHFLNGSQLLSTTQVLKVLSKPLTWWASGLACTEFGWIKSLEKERKATDEEKDRREKERWKSAFDMLVKLRGMTPEEYVDLCDHAYKAHSVKLDTASSGGIDLHDVAEMYIKCKIAGVRFQHQAEDQIAPFVEWAEKEVKEFLFTEAHCYSSVLGVGGITDFGCILKSGVYMLADVKSAKDAYFDHYAQLGGYDIQIEENGVFTEDGRKLSVKLKPFTLHGVFAFGGKDGFKAPVVRHTVDLHKRAFKYATALFNCTQEFKE